MSNETFDPDVFMQQTVDAPMATDYLLCPEGYFQAMVDDFENDKAFASGEKDGRRWVKLNVPFSIQDPGVLAALGRDKITVRGSWFIDFEEGSSAPSTKPGTNVLLGRLRSALNQNSGPWNFSMLKGAGPVTVRVKHRADSRDSSKVYAEVVDVAPVR